MAQKQGIYKCEICGNVVNVIEEHAGELVCCNKPMVLLEEQNSGDKAVKHVPIVNIEGNNITIKVGEVQHVSTNEHYIELIEIICENGQIYSKKLTPNDEPIAIFSNIPNINNIKVRILCNLDGLWVNK